MDAQIGNVPSGPPTPGSAYRQSRLVFPPSPWWSPFLIFSLCDPGHSQPSFLNCNMPISFRRTPFLIQKEVIQQMCLQEAFNFSLTSKKTLVLVKCCLSLQQFHIRYYVYSSSHAIVVMRKSGIDDFDGMKVSCRAPGDEQIGPTEKMSDENSNIATQSISNVYQYLVDMFPKAKITLDFEVTDGEIITKISNMANVELVILDFGRRRDHHIIEAALQESTKTKKLRIENVPNFDFQLNPELRCNLEYLYIDNCKWIGKQQLIQNFLNCKQVILPYTSCGLNDSDYPEFLESWMKGSRMELLKIGGRWIDKHKVAGTVGVLPGAVEVRRARVWEDKEESMICFFEPGCCYMVQRADGTRAIVSWLPHEFLLTTKFEILEEARKRTADQ